jgi:predicted nuclease of predicted toxin-antitoxin system
VKLLFDHNLSPRLVAGLSNTFPESSHVFLLEMAEADDQVVWDYANKHQYIIVTRDRDYNDLLTLKGYPPKVIWIRRGNCSTQVIETILRHNFADIQSLIADPTLGLLTLF